MFGCSALEGSTFGWAAFDESVLDGSALGWGRPWESDVECGGVAVVACDAAVDAVVDAAVDADADASVLAVTSRMCGRAEPAAVGAHAMDS
ncbi:hypothetical protein MXD61_08235 [Frankia sp. AgPm24]|uniref:hypothetical protein n=1 Tax=Frankia sp. AgPm24 TaxID=631128 RepID=UPI00200DB98C|nr:hypothetical protein [Frankia sp. AgPm24]MCK9921873.1 hypothetical protein [Frankia sp. AgPm24]